MDQGKFSYGLCRGTLERKQSFNRVERALGHDAVVDIVQREKKSEQKNRHWQKAFTMPVFSGELRLSVLTAMAIIRKR